MTREVSNSDDIIDSRDVIARIEELRDLLTPQDENDPIAESEDYEDEREELKALEALAKEGEGYAADWHHGETLIRDSYFETYAQELAEDIDLIKPDAQWPYTCIDWEQAARELRMDYSSIDFDGVTYWVR